MGSIRKEVSPPLNKPFDRIGGKGARFLGTPPIALLSTYERN
jgi:hypothetical protein